MLKFTLSLLIAICACTSFAKEVRKPAAAGSKAPSYAGNYGQEDVEAFRVNSTVIELVKQGKPVALICASSGGTDELKKIEKMNCKYRLYATDVTVVYNIVAELDTNTGKVKVVSETSTQE